MESYVIAAAAVIRLLTTVLAGSQKRGDTTTLDTSGSVIMAPKKRTVIRHQLASAVLVTIKERASIGTTISDSLKLSSAPESIVSDIPSAKGHPSVGIR